MKTAPGEKEVIDLVITYLPVALSPDAVSHLMAVASALMQLYPAYNQHPCAYPPHATEPTKAAGKRIIPVKYHRTPGKQNRE